MCGITGVLNGPGLAPVELDELRSMVAMLQHRGPDGYGFYRDEHVGLGHARLSIIDLSTGDQPLTNEDGTVWLTFNGEIFNYLELRRELADRGHRFVTQGDSEVIVHAYEEWGEGAWGRLNGQFAVALWDRRRRRLWLARDRVGILPLHYAVADGRLLFASEAKALFASGHLSPALDAGGLGEIFTRWSAAAPRTVFAGVRSVRPGTAVCVDEQLSCVEHVWWQPDFSVDPDLADLSLDSAADLLGERLGEAVRLRLRADVPVGAYLSGGLDSSVIASLVDRGDAPLETFAVRFADPTFDETAEQRRMAALLGTEHHEIVCGPDEIADALLDVVWHCEAPQLRTGPAAVRLLRVQGGRAAALLGTRPEVVVATGARGQAPPGDRRGRRHPRHRDVGALLRPRPRRHRPPLLLAPDPLAEHRLVPAAAGARLAPVARRRRCRRGHAGGEHAARLR